MLPVKICEGRSCHRLWILRLLFFSFWRFLLHLRRLLFLSVSFGCRVLGVILLSPVRYHLFHQWLWRVTQWFMRFLCNQIWYRLLFASIVISILSSKRATHLFGLFRFPINWRIPLLNLLVDFLNFNIILVLFLILFLLIFFIIWFTFLLFMLNFSVLGRWEIWWRPLNKTSRQLWFPLLLLDLLLWQSLLWLISLFLLVLYQAFCRYPKLNFPLPPVLNGCQLIFRLRYMMLFFHLSFHLLFFFFTCSTIIISMNYQLILRFFDVGEVTGLMIEGLKLSLDPREKFFFLVQNLVEVMLIGASGNSGLSTPRTCQSWQCWLLR